MTRWKALFLVSLVWLPLHGCGDATCPPSPPHGTPPPAPTTHRVPAEYSTIQEAMDAAVDGDTVLVSPGTYEGPGNVNLNPNGVSMVIRSVAGPESTIIRLRSGSSSVRAGFSVQSGETHPMAIQGFTFRDGAPDLGSPRAILCVRSRLLVQDCHVIHHYGPAIWLLNSIATLERCRVEDTFSPNAPIMVIEGTARIDRCIVRRNASDEFGGAIRVSWGFATLSECEITQNYCESGLGGALHLDRASVSIISCLITRNRATYGAGAIFAANTVLSINYCTISENAAPDGGGGIGISSNDTSIIMNNSILAANWPEDVVGFGGVLRISGSAVDTTRIHGDADFHYDATIITADPELCRLEGAFSTQPSDYHPRPGSPCLTPYRIGALPSGCNE